MIREDARKLTMTIRVERVEREKLTLYELVVRDRDTGGLRGDEVMMTGVVLHDTFLGQN